MTTTYHTFGLLHKSFQGIADLFSYQPQYVKIKQTVPEKVDLLVKYQITAATKDTSYIVKLEEGKKPLVTFFKPVNPSQFTIPLLRTAEGVYAMMNHRFPGEEGGLIYPGSEYSSNTPLKCIKGRGKFYITTEKKDATAVKISCAAKPKPSEKIDAVLSRCETASSKQLHFLDIDLKEHSLTEALDKLKYDAKKSSFTAIPLTPYLEKKKEFVKKYGIPMECQRITDALFEYLAVPEKTEVFQNESYSGALALGVAMIASACLLVYKSC